MPKSAIRMLRDVAYGCEHEKFYFFTDFLGILMVIEVGH